MKVLFFEISELGVGLNKGISICESFIRKNPIFNNSQKFLPAKDSRYTVYVQISHQSPKKKMCENFHEVKISWEQILNCYA